jgi:membrane-associated phospholipid phosphatase
MIVDFKKKTKTGKSPFKHKSKYILACSLAIIVLLSYFIDKPFALFFYSLKGDLQEPLELINRLFSPMLSLLVFPSLFFVIRFLARQERKSRKFWFLSLAIPLATLPVKVLEIIFGRSDPDWLFSHQEMTMRLFNWDPSFHSFPSDISSTIGAIATCLALVYPKKSRRFFIGGACLSLVPALSTTCFLTDALVGAGIGFVASSFLYNTMRKELSF